MGSSSIASTTLAPERGAVVTEAGQAVLAEYRALEAEAERAGAPHVARLQALMRDIPEGT